MADTLGLNADFCDLLNAFAEAGVQYLVVGAHALAAHGVVRATGDLDVWVRPSEANAERVILALQAFGAPLGPHGVSVKDFARPGTVYQMGLPPSRIDVLTDISGVDFDTAFQHNLPVQVSGATFCVPNREALLANKRAAGRPKDLLDVELLEALGAEAARDRQGK